MIKYNRDIKNAIIVILTVVVLVGMLWAFGCKNNTTSPPHATLDKPSGYEVKCQLCYDKIVRIRRPDFGKTGSNIPSYKSVTKHMCPECKGMSEIYSQDGEFLFKCDKCAPEGVPCDRCIPPKSKTGN